MALINFYKGLKENYSPDTHGNSIYSCTDTNECYILGVLYENISEQEIADKIGTNTYTDANYISKETNLTDAALQLDEEIKATNDNIDILNAATIKGVATISASNKVEVLNGIAVIPLLSDNSSGVLDISHYRFINNGYDANIPILGSNSSGDYIFAGYKDDNGLRLPITSTLDPDTTEYLYIMWANESNGGLMSSTDYEKLNNIENTYVPLTGDSFKNNNACWGGTTTDGTTYCLALIDESDRVKIGNTNLPLYLRGSSIQFDDNSGDYYTVYHSNNFKAGVNYVAPEDVKSLVFTQSAGANGTNAANYLKVRDGYFNIVVAHNDKYYTPNEINTTNPDSIAISFSTFIPTGYNIYQVIVTADGTCIESLFTSFTVPTVNVVSEFPTELDSYADGSIFIKE